MEEKEHKLEGRSEKFDGKFKKGMSEEMMEGKPEIIKRKEMIQRAE